MVRNDEFSTVAQQVIAICADQYKIPVEEVKGLGRKRPLPDCKKTISLILKRYSTSYDGSPNWTRIGREFRTHPTFKHCSVYYLSNRAEDLLQTDAKFNAMHEKCEKRCKDEINVRWDEQDSLNILSISKQYLTSIGVDVRGAEMFRLRELARKIRTNYKDQLDEIVKKAASRL